MKKTIAEKKGVSLEDIKINAPLDEWFYEMLKKSEDELSVRDISHMLRQEVYLDIAVSLGWKKIIENPLCGEMYEGQMLDLLTRVFVHNPEYKDYELFRRFEKRMKEVYESYQWDTDYEEKEVDKSLVNFRQLFLS